VGEYRQNYFLLAVFYKAHLKEYKQANKIILEKLVNDKNSQKIAHYSMATVYFDHGDFEAADKKLVTLLNNEQSLLRKMSYIDDIVANYSAQSRYSDAIKFLKAQIALDDEVVQYQHQLAELYLISGRKKAANKQLDLVLTKFPEYKPSYIIKGRQLAKEKDMKNAIEFLTQALEKHPDTVELWTDFSKLYFNVKQYSKALLTLENAIKAIPNNPFLTFELASMYDFQGELSKSEPLYIKILQNYPEYLPALDNLASNFFTLDTDLDKATVLAKRAYLLSPNDVFIKNLRAQAHINENEHDLAIELISSVVDDFGQSGLGHFTLAKAYIEMKKNDLAKQNLTIALAKNLPELIRKKALKLQELL